MRMRGLVGGAVAMTLACAFPAPAFYAGAGKDAAKGNDCLIGYEGIDAGDVTLDGKKQVVTCTDCDPACDGDGVPTANGSCTFQLGACINQPGVEGCTPPAGLDKTKASAKVQGVKGKVDIQVPQLLEGSACGALLDLVVPVKDTKKGSKDGKGTVSLSATLKKDKPAGIDKTRTDDDKIIVVCVPRPAGEACPVTSTTSTTVETTSTTVTTTTSSTSSTVPPSTTSTTLPGTTTSTSTTLVTTTTSTSTSTTTTTSPPDTTTSTTVETTTTTSVPSTTVTTSTSTSLTSTTSTSTTTSTTTSTVIPALCGNGAVDDGESCDDGNNSDNDACPANCAIAGCTPVDGSQRPVTVSFTPPSGASVAAMTVLVNYPEGQVTIPGAGTVSATYFVPTHPTSEVLTRGTDLDHALRGLVADSSPLPEGPVFQVLFQDCTGTEPPVAGAFHCSVLDASDAFTNPVPGVTCAVSIP